MKFDLPKGGKINPEPPGLMVVKDNATAADYTDLFPTWTVISVTKITEKTRATYAELFDEFDRIVFWHPSGFIKAPNKRFLVLQSLCKNIGSKLEVYGFHGSARHPADTVEQMMVYLPCLFPGAELPVHQMETHIAWGWRSFRRQPSKQVQVTKWSNTPHNLALIKSAINP